MALHAPVVQDAEDQQAAAAEVAEAMPAPALAPASTAPKPESVTNPVSQDALAVPFHVVPQAEAVSVLAAPPHPQPILSDPNKSPTGSETVAGQGSADPGAKADTGPPSSLRVVCADAQGQMTLDLQKMKCFILYKGI